MTKVRLPARIADYFVVVGADPNRENNGTRTRSGHAKRPTAKTNFAPVVIDRFPQEDFKDAQFPKDVPMFCFPQGLVLSNQQKKDDAFNFVLTEADGTRVYGTVLRYLELQPEESKEKARTQLQVTNENGEPIVQPKKSNYLPKALCIVSHWAFFSQFHRFLKNLYRQLQNADFSVPIERVVANFVLEVPLPPPGRIEVEYHGLSDITQLFVRPPPNQRPLRDYPLSALCRYLSADNIITLFSAVCTERRILFVSNHLKRLTLAAETMSCFMFPLFWRHIYIPVLPVQLIDFVCAPMPFMVGVHSAYMPDEIMLDRVVVVSLDDNKIQVSDPELVPALPEKRYASMIKNLKRRLGNDSTLPIKKGQSVSEGELESVFLKFFIKIFKAYKSYLEAPSDFVVDKFDKQRFISEHPDKSRFLQDFCETQMFQCFVDDRYDANNSRSGTANSLELLYFDESIDAHSHKKTPFLSDTSQNHDSSKRFQVIRPNKDGLDKKKWNYGGKFPALQKELFYPVREVERLADETSVQTTIHNELSMQFFTEKRMFSQHFHALSLRSRKQDLVFKDICHYLRTSQRYDEKFTAEFDELCGTTVDKDSIETKTSIDGAWAALKKFVGNSAFLEGDAFKMIREETCSPLTVICSASEHQLRILFQEASILEEKTGTGKASVEKAKIKSEIMQRKYEAIKKASGQGTLTAGEIHRVVTAQSEAEEAALNLDEEETAFQTVVSEYEKRMPEIIKTIRQLNKDRISIFKSAMVKWVEAKRAVVNGMTNALDNLEQMVDKLNPEKDLQHFTEGTVDFWNAGGVGMGARSQSVIPDLDTVATHNIDSLKALAGTTNTFRPNSPTHKEGEPHADNDRPTRAPPAAPADTGSPEVLNLPSVNSITSDKLCFSLNLWGGNGFDAALAQSSGTKDTLKNFVSTLDEWSVIQEGKSKKLFSLARGFAIPTDLESTQKLLWQTLRDRSLVHAKAHTEFANVLAKLSSDLKITRGELKRSVKRFIDHRIKLQKELQERTDNLLKAHDKRIRARSTLNTVETTAHANSVMVAPTTLQQEKAAVRREKVGRDFKEAEHLYELADRDRLATQRKHDVCLSRILDLFERKEVQCGTELKKTLQILMDCIQNYLLKIYAKCDVSLISSIKGVDAEKDLREFVSTTFSADTPPHLRLQPGEDADFAKHLGLNGFEVADLHINTGLANMKNLTTFLEEFIMIKEGEERSMRKTSFNLNAPSQTMSAALVEFSLCLDQLMTLMEQETTSIKGEVEPFIQVRGMMKETIKNNERTYQDIQKTYQKVVMERDAAQAAVAKSLTNLKSCRQKMIEKAEYDEKQQDKKSLLDKLKAATQQSMEQLKKQEQDLMKDLDEKKEFLKQKEKLLESTNVFRAQSISSLLTQMKKTEEQRVEHILHTFNKIMELHKTRLVKSEQLVDKLEHKVNVVEVLNDIQVFLKFKKTGMEPPESVIEDFLKQKIAEPDKIRQTMEPSQQPVRLVLAESDKESLAALYDAVPTISRAASSAPGGLAAAASLGALPAPVGGAHEGSKSDLGIKTPSLSRESSQSDMKVKSRRNSDSVSDSKAELLPKEEQPHKGKKKGEDSDDEEIPLPVAPVPKEQKKAKEKEKDNKDKEKEKAKEKDKEGEQREDSQDRTKSPKTTGPGGGFFSRGKPKEKDPKTSTMSSTTSASSIASSAADPDRAKSADKPSRPPPQAPVEAATTERMKSPDKVPKSSFRDDSLPSSMPASTSSALSGAGDTDEEEELMNLVKSPTKANTNRFTVAKGVPPPTSSSTTTTTSPNSSKSPPKESPKSPPKGATQPADAKKAEDSERNKSPDRNKSPGGSSTAASQATGASSLDVPKSAKSPPKPTAKSPVSSRNNSPTRRGGGDSNNKPQSPAPKR